MEVKAETQQKVAGSLLQRLPLEKSNNDFAMNKCKKQIGDCKKKIGDCQREIEDASRICRKIIERASLPTTLPQAPGNQSTLEEPATQEATK